MRLKYINLYKFYSAIQPYIKFSTQLLQKFTAKKIFVISPHIDDDIIGAGGSIYKYINCGGEATVVYLVGSNAKRVKEAYAVNELIKYKKIYLYEYEDNSIEKYNEIAVRIENILLQENPESVFLPFLVDNHRDHIATNKFFVECMKHNKFQFEIFAYEVWSPIYPNFIVDITDVIGMKKNCLEIYQSQLKDHDYIEQAISLNRFRGGTFSKNVKYAEAFFKSSIDSYISLWEKIYD